MSSQSASFLPIRAIAQHEFIDDRWVPRRDAAPSPAAISSDPVMRLGSAQTEGGG